MRWAHLERLLHPIWPALSIVASLAIVGCAIPRGLDLTDESLYVLLAQTDTPRSLSVIHTQLLSSSQCARVQLSQWHGSRRRQPERR